MVNGGLDPDLAVDVHEVPPIIIIIIISIISSSSSISSMFSSTSVISSTSIISSDIILGIFLSSLRVFTATYKWLRLKQPTNKHVDM